MVVRVQIVDYYLCQINEITRRLLTDRNGNLDPLATNTHWLAYILQALLCSEKREMQPAVSRHINQEHRNSIGTVFKLILAFSAAAANSLKAGLLLKFKIYRAGWFRNRSRLGIANWLAEVALVFCENLQFQKTLLKSRNYAVANYEHFSSTILCSSPPMPQGHSSLLYHSTDFNLRILLCYLKYAFMTFSRQSVLNMYEISKTRQ